jgi:hypothetical protein
MECVTGSSKSTHYTAATHAQAQTAGNHHGNIKAP